MPRLIQASEPVARRRRVYFQLVGTDGMTPAPDEVGGQPQMNADGAGFVDAGMGVLRNHDGGTSGANPTGRYYSDISQEAVEDAGVWIETRYKSANTAECPGDSAYVVNYPPDESQSAEGVWNYGRRTLTGTGQVTVIGPVASSGAIRIIRGDDYLHADGRSLTWTDRSGVWPDLTGSTLVVRIYQGSLSGILVSYDHVVVVNPGDPTQVMELELTAEQTAAFAEGVYSYEIEATLSNGHTATLVQSRAGQTTGWMVTD